MNDIKIVAVIAISFTLIANILIEYYAYKNNWY